MKIFVDEQKKKTMQDYVKTATIHINSQDCGGESVYLEVDYFQNSDGDVYHNTRFVNHCYGTHVSTISYYGVSLNQIQKCIEEAMLVSREIENNFNED